MVEIMQLASLKLILIFTLFKDQDSNEFCIIEQQYTALANVSLFKE